MTIIFNGNEIPLKGTPIQAGDFAKEFILVKNDLSDWKLSKQKGKIVFNIFPSIDNRVCAASTEEFNKKAQDFKDIQIQCVSKDLPFAQHRFCCAKKIEQIGILSAFRNQTFGTDYGLEIAAGPLTGLYTRAVVIIEYGRILYTEIVPEITNEPNYDAALAACVGS